MQAAAELMSWFPAGYVATSEPFPALDEAAASVSGTSVQELLADPGLQVWLHGVVDGWPEDFVPVFLEASSLIAQILAAFGVDNDDADANLFELAVLDPGTLQLMAAVGHVEQELAELREADETNVPQDPMGLQSAATVELLRRRVAHRAPFARTLTTLLGPDALLWLVTQSSTGVGKLQPHEFSRTNWCRLWEIETQTAMEQELLAVDPEAEHLSKIVVALSWTLAALASFVTPAVFLEEATSHLVSVRDGQYTVAAGTDSRTLVAFDTSSMRAVVAVLAEALTNPLLTAADLLWIGAAVAQVRHVTVRNVDPITVDDERFGLFLSHRGLDAKLPLSVAVRALPPGHGVFLDCLVMPRGVVNRSFIYGSLARSDRVLIVQTEHYDDSTWCRKEAWFCDALARHGLARVERDDLRGALTRVTADGGRTRRRHSDRRLHYPIADRVLRDLDYWARAPNLHSLREAGHATDAFEELRSLASEPRPDDAAWTDALGNAVARTTARVASDAPDAEPLDLWCTALQFSVAALASTSNARSKDEVRRGIDHLNAAVKELATEQLHLDAIFRERAAGYLALLAAASSIQLAGFELDKRITPALNRALADTAILHDGQLLLDAREPGPLRAFHLRLVATLIRSNLGSVGIVQNAGDEVHEQRIGSVYLEVLPCVTLHPGIEPPHAIGPAPGKEQN